MMLRVFLFVGKPSVSVRAKVAKNIQCPSVRSRREVAGKRHLPGHCHWVCGSRTSAGSEQEKPSSLHSASTFWAPTVHQPLFRRVHRTVRILHSWAALCRTVLVLLPADPHLFPHTGQSQCPCSQDFWQEQTCVTGSTIGKEDVMQQTLRKCFRNKAACGPIRHQPMFIFFLHTPQHLACPYSSISVSRFTDIDWHVAGDNSSECLPFYSNNNTPRGAVSKKLVCWCH